MIYDFDVTCSDSVPESIIAFLESSDVESAIRLAISLGRDADTQAAIAGNIAEVFYQNDENAVHGLLEMVSTMMDKPYLDQFLHQVTTAFYEKYIPESPILPLLKSRKILGF